MEFEFRAFGQRSLDFGADIFGDVVDRSLAKTTRYNWKSHETEKYLLALRMPICACEER